MLRVCWFWLILTALLGSASGCTPLRTWVRNGFKVGPNHVPPTVDVEKDWIDQDSPLLATDPVDEGAWWRVLGDPARAPVRKVFLLLFLQKKKSLTCLGSA